MASYHYLCKGIFGGVVIMFKTLGVRIKRVAVSQLAAHIRGALLGITAQQTLFTEFNRLCTEYISFILGSENKAVNPKTRADARGCQVCTNELACQGGQSLHVWLLHSPFLSILAALARYLIQPRKLRETNPETFVL